MFKFELESSLPLEYYNEKSENSNTKLSLLPIIFLYLLQTYDPIKIPGKNIDFMNSNKLPVIVDEWKERRPVPLKI